VLAAYEVLQGLHDRGVLELMRGTLGGSEKIPLIAYMRQTTGSYSGALHIISGVMAISALVPILVSRPGGGAVDSRARTKVREPASATSIRQH
jgi:hypothetical protein